MAVKDAIMQKVNGSKATRMAAVALGVAAAVLWAHAPVLSADSTPESLAAVKENNAAVEALARKDFDDAIAHLHLAHSREPTNRTILHNLVGALDARAKKALAAGRSDDAERDFVEALALAPDDKATALHAAGFFNNRAVAFLRAHQMDQARGCFEQALSCLPQLTDTTVTAQIKTNYSNFLTAEGSLLVWGDKVEQARARYTEAVSYNPRSAAALAGLADLDYDNDDYARALGLYQKAREAALGSSANDLRAAIEVRVDTLQKEMAIEADFVTIHDQAGRFRLYMSRDFPKGVVARVLQTLNDADEKVGRDFDFHPRRPLTVKIYSRPQLAAIQQIPAWVGGFFDGKIRLIESRLLESAEQLRRSIFHEYTHAVIHWRGGEAVPSWIHEGLAQIEVPDSNITPRDVRYVAARVRTRQAASLAELARPFDHSPSEDRLSLIYLQSKLLVDFLLQRDGWETMRRLLSETRDLHDFDAAFSRTYSTTTADMEIQWRRWLIERDEKGQPPGR